MKLHLSHSPNPDITGGYWETPTDPGSIQTVEARDYAQASEFTRAYIVRNQLGAGNFTGGRLDDDQGTPVARVAYNGRVFEWTALTIRAQLAAKCLYEPAFCADRLAEDADGDFTNGQRANHASEALEHYRVARGMYDHDEEDIVNLIADLIHLAHSKGHCGKDIMTRAAVHYAAESGVGQEAMA